MFAFATGESFSGSQEDVEVAVGSLLNESAD
ncbi:hypothetical protein HG15A2_30440 [Adhaeretor mobilis]|uniref:Uncharacterized protein n=1 Tax=Adhaeretor mobilis TaxID=1930276 RepID=A0A517MXW1_9BACT|nr:hypothetical protein HG15A2_30440 [Adhaeretor mobilis]